MALCAIWAANPSNLTSLHPSSLPALHNSNLIHPLLPVFTVPGRENAATLICGLVPGTWTVTAPDGRQTTQAVSGESHCLYLSCDPGEWVLARESDADQ